MAQKPLYNVEEQSGAGVHKQVMAIKFLLNPEVPTDGATEEY
jgi:hypothetical protein